MTQKHKKMYEGMSENSRSNTHVQEWFGHLPGGHLPAPKLGHLPRTFARRTTATPNFFWLTFLGFFDLQLMEDIKDGKEEVLDEVVMEHIK